MQIGFDAKRAFFNYSGLGNYSRYVISGICNMYPENEYLLYTPGKGKYVPPENSRIIEPDSLGKKFPSLWRSFSLARKITKDHTTLYHGLSNEIPAGSEKRPFKTCVTIHDLIFMKYPAFYPVTDRMIYRKKVLYAVKNAGHIIATSEQTRRDLIELLHAVPEKISVVYQGCNPAFYIPAAKEEKERIRKKYNLPENFLLSVGTVEERKNLLRIAEAMHTGKIDFPVIAAGRRTPYAVKVEKYINEKKINHFRLIGEIPAEDLPALYQMATAFLYPSLYEGFGIPVLEAINSGVPVITSAGGCLEETGGKGAVLVNPLKSEEIADAIRLLLDNSQLRETLIEKGYSHAAGFRDEVTIPRLYSVYESCLK